MRKMTLDLNDLAVDSFDTAPAAGTVEPDGLQAQSKIYNTVYYYYETEQISCGCVVIA